MKGLLRCLILYLSSLLLVCCIFTTDSNQETILCFFSLLFNDTAQLSLSIARLHQFHFLQWDLSMKCLETLKLLPQFYKSLWKSWAHFIHLGAFMKSYLLRKAFLYKLTWTFTLSASVKIGYWTLKFLREAYEQHSEFFCVYSD